MLCLRCNYGRGIASSQTSIVVQVCCTTRGCPQLTIDSGLGGEGTWFVFVGYAVPVPWSAT